MKMEKGTVMNKSKLCLVVLVAGVFLLAGSASAGTLTFNSWSNDSAYNNFTYSPGNASVNPNEFPLQEFDMYTWGIAPINLTGQTITSASITINNIGNWSGNSDELFMHLLDSATNLNVTQFEWTTNGNEPNPPFVDHFLAPYNTMTTAYGLPYNLVGNTVNNLLSSSSVNNIVLNDGTYSYVASNGGPGLPSNFSLTNIDFNQTQGSSGYAGGNFTYNFSAADLAVLAADIADGNNIALGFDADCHFWNDGITLTINTQAAGGTGTPEPATLTLFALGLAGVLRKRLRKA
jgi:hypothetical protein